MPFPYAEIPKDSSPIDITAMLRGTNAVVAAVAQLWPKADGNELLTRIKAIEEAPIAQELLAMVLADRKIELYGPEC
jgi:hypothetical protein